MDKAQRNRERCKIYYRKARQLLIELKSVPCTDCGFRFPHWIMQFDHIKPRKWGVIGRMHSIKRILEEVERCQVVCCNCHANRTYWRNQIESR